MRIIYAISLIFILSGCIVAQRNTYSFDDPSIYDGMFNLKNKYHILSMSNRFHYASEGADTKYDLVSEKSRAEIEDYEQCLPNVFHPNGIPVRISQNINYKNNVDFLTVLNVIVGVASLWIVPVTGLDGSPESEMQVSVSSSNMREGCMTTVCRSDRSWVSTIGLGELMPMPTPPDSRFSVEFSKSIFSSSVCAEVLAMDNKAIAYAIAASLQKLEQANNVPILHRRGIRIGN